MIQTNTCTHKHTHTGKNAIISPLLLTVGNKNPSTHVTVWLFNLSLAAQQSRGRKDFNSIHTVHPISCTVYLI